MGEQYSAIFTPLNRLFSHLRDKLESLHMEPTLADPNDIREAIKNLPAALPEVGYDVSQTIKFVEHTILPALAPGHAGPRYFGFVTGGTVPAALMGDVLTSLYDQNVQAHLPGETISTVVEATALEMILELLNLPLEAFPLRTITTGATASNVLGLACGRDFAARQALGIPEYSVAEDGIGGATIKVLSDRPHASLIKAASIVGIGRSNVLDLYNPVTRQLDLLELEKHLSSSSLDRARVGFIVSPSFGEVNTGDFTANMRKIRELCDKHGAWMHVDGAFGAFARVVPELAHFAEGLEFADSITGDGHKWLNVPYDAGLFFSRSVQLQTSIFGPSPRAPPPAYLSTPAAFNLPPEISNIPSPLNLGIENSRRFRGLPLFCALYSLGRRGYEEMIRRHVSFARHVSAWMSSTTGGARWYEVLNASFSEGQAGAQVVPLNIVLFRARESSVLYQPDSSSKLIQAINDTRNLYVSPGKDGAARLAVSNWLTGLRRNEEGKNDLEIVVSTLKKVMQPT